MIDDITIFTEELIYTEKISLNCKRCGQNKKKFHYRETNGCTIVNDESNKLAMCIYPFNESVIECVDCGNIIWRSEEN